MVTVSGAQKYAVYTLTALSQHTELRLLLTFKLYSRAIAHFSLIIFVLRVPERNRFSYYSSSSKMNDDVSPDRTQEEGPTFKLEHCLCLELSRFRHVFGLKF